MFTITRAFLVFCFFDPWFAKKAEEAGALIMTGTQVDDLLWEGERVIGVSD